MTAQCAVRAAKRGCCTAPSIKWILHLIERNAFSSRPCGTPGRKRRKESIFALAGHALLRKNAPRSAQVAAADYTWRGCGPSKPPRGFRFPGIHCCSFFYENQYTCKQRGYCRLASATSPFLLRLTGGAGLPGSGAPLYGQFSFPPADAQRDLLSSSPRRGSSRCAGSSGTAARRPRRARRDTGRPGWPGARPAADRRRCARRR